MSRVALASLLVPLVLSTGAQAATVTLSSWTWGNGNAVSVGSPAYQGAAGGFSGSLSGSGVPGLDGAIQTYCVDLGQSFSFGIAYTDFTLVDAESYFGAEKAQALARLLSFVGDHHLFAATAAGSRDDLSTALQLAIWNLRYDGDDSLAAGSFTSGSAAFAQALAGSQGFWGSNALLNASQGAAVTRTLWVLQSPTRQDQLVWQLSAGVPEPATWALLAAAVVGAGAARRRRVSAGG